MVNIIFCLPGKEFSNTFLVNWSKTLYLLTKNGYNYTISNSYDSNVFFVRNKCLGGNVLNGKDQKVFQGNADYDYIFWIDSDIIFMPEQVLNMIGQMEDNKKLNILSGLYLMEGGTEYATVDKDRFNYNEFINHNGRFPFINREEILLKNGKHFEVDYTGFGFICIRKGVFEQLEYPWFKPVFMDFEVNISTNKKSSTNDLSNNVDMEVKEIEETKRYISDTCSEDVAFCRMIIDKGETIICDPTIIVGHEKTIIEYFNANSILEKLKNQDNYQEQIKLLEEKYKTNYVK